LRVSQDDAGGYTVSQAIFQQVVQDIVAQSALLRAGSRMLTTQGDSLALIKFSNAVPAWVAEIPSSTPDADPDVEARIAVLKKLRFLGSVSEGIAADSDIDVLGEVIPYISDLVAYYGDLGLISGDGIGNNPAGLIGDAELPTDTVDLTDPASVISLFAQLPSRFEAGAVVMVNAVGLGVLRSVQAVPDGRPYFDGLFQLNKSLLGFPVIVTDALGDDKLLLGNFAKGHVTVTKPGGIAIRVLPELYADIDCIGFRVTWRAGGVLTLPEAFIYGT
jgi:HK97 family phage major capsid protein